jgi:mxaK protein
MTRALDLSLWLALATALAAAAYAGATLAGQMRDARLVASIERGDDVSINAQEASPPVLLARAKFLTERQLLDDAQALLDAARDAPEEARADLHYVVSRARLQRAVREIERGEIDRGVADVALAKTHLRETLRVRPGWWDAKRNLDVAMRLVRDFPQGEGSVEEPPEDAPKRLWTDVPGAPRGLP